MEQAQADQMAQGKSIVITELPNGAIVLGGNYDVMRALRLSLQLLEKAKQILIFPPSQTQQAGIVEPGPVDERTLAIIRGKS